MTEFRHRRVVRFGECDPAGVVYYPVFFSWFHEAMEAWFEQALNRPYAQVIKTVGFPAVNTEATFKRPCHVGDEVFVMLSLSKLERASMTLQFRIIDSQERLRATGSVTCVSIGVSEGDFQFKAIRIPTELSELMKDYCP